MRRHASSLSLKSGAIAVLSLGAIALPAAALGGCNLLAGLDSVKFEGSGGAGGATTSGGTSGSSASQGGNTTASQGGSTTSAGGTGGTGGVTTMGAGGAPAGAVECGAKTCTTPAHACCWDKYGQGAGGVSSGKCLATPVDPALCNTKAEPGGLQTVIACQTANECPMGEICCADLSTFAIMGQTVPYYRRLFCSASCDDPLLTTCSGKGDPSCPAGTLCKSSTVLPEGYFLCVP